MGQHSRGSGAADGAGAAPGLAGPERGTAGTARPQGLRDSGTAALGSPRRRRVPQVPTVGIQIKLNIHIHIYIYLKDSEWRQPPALLCAPRPCAEPPARLPLGPAALTLPLPSLLHRWLPAGASRAGGGGSCCNFRFSRAPLPLPGSRWERDGLAPPCREGGQRERRSHRDKC